MRIKKRKFLVVPLIASQLACMLFGLATTSGWLNRVVTQVIQRQVDTEGRVITHELANRVTDLRIDTLASGTPDWQRLQALCESAQIPHNGFACLFRMDDGSLVCHSSLRENPALREQFPGRSMLAHENGAEPILTVAKHAVNRGERLIRGVVDVEGQLYEMSGYAIPEVDAVIAVHQSDASIEQSISNLILPVTQVGWVLTAFTVGASSLLTVFIVGRYENSLAEVNASLERQVEERTQSLLKTRNAVIFGLAKLAESRDSDTGSHLERIRSYVTVLATELGLRNPEITRQYVANLEVASSLHDIGKVGVPDSILLKPDVLTPDERRAMQLHTSLGSDCLAAIQEKLGADDFLELAKEIAAAHHEQWDGSGYPHQLAGQEIPLSARIVALADVYDALTSERPYKDSLGHAEAREWIATRCGTHFDPVVVEAFVARDAEFARIAQSQTNRKRLATKPALTATDEANQATSSGPLQTPTEKAAAAESDNLVVIGE